MDRSKQLNKFPASEQGFDFDQFLQKSVKPHAAQLDSDPRLVADCIREILNGLKSKIVEKVVLPSPDQLEDLYGVSTALAFTLAQHVSAVERLDGLPEWQTSNPQIWSDIAGGRILCGLATTNLGKPGGAGVQAVETPEGFTLQGLAPWVCGYGLFDYVVLGFETPDSVVFALIEAPHPLRPSSLLNVEATPHNLSCLNGTATFQLKFLSKNIPHSTVVSRKLKAGPAIPRPSKYLIPELGMAKGAMNAISDILMASDHPRQIYVKEALSQLQSRLDRIKALRLETTSTDILNPMRDELVRDANRLLVLATGSNALIAGSLASRLQLEFMLLDTIVQTPKVLARKAFLSGVEKDG